jgi:ABC-type transport system involved in multi-copper enzyme maturation permease subunit
MLRKVIHQDLLVNRWGLLVNWTVSGMLLSYIAAQPDVRASHFAVFASLMCAFAPVTLLVHEDKCKCASLTCSLPVTRRTIVAARYALAGLLTAVGLVGVTALVLALPFSHLTARELLAPGVLLSALAISGTLSAFMLPFTIRFGMAGLMAFMVSAQVVGIALFMMVQISGSSGDRRIARALLQALRDAHTGLGSPAFELVVLAALSLIVALSFAVSVRLFERRDL